MLTRRRLLLSAAASAPVVALRAQQPTSPPPAPAAEPPLPAPLLALQDRRKDIVPIRPAEREARVARARELMKQNRIDAILITTGSSLAYFTAGHMGQSERLFAYILPAAAAPFVICPAFERDRLAELMEKFPERETTLSYLWQENEDPFAILHRAFADNNMASGTIGLDDKVQYAFSSAIAQASPAAKFVSAAPVVAGCRSIKSPAEIALLRLANGITYDVYRAVFKSCGPGDTALRFTTLIDRAYERCGVRGEASCNVGPHSASPHGSMAPQTIREHEIVLIDDGCSVEGYQSDISRTFVYGTPTDQQRRLFQTVRDAQSAALAAAHPGVEMQAIDAAARNVILKTSGSGNYDYFTHRVGHGIGMDGHEWPYLVGGNRQKLAANMVFSDEPGVYLRGKFGIRLEDDMLITELGAELLTPQSPSLEEPFAPA